MLPSDKDLVAAAFYMAQVAWRAAKVCHTVSHKRRSTSNVAGIEVIMDWRTGCEAAVHTKKGKAREHKVWESARELLASADRICATGRAGRVCDKASSGE